MLGNVDVSEVPGDVQVLSHRAADDRDLPPALDGDVRGLLHAVDVRRERRDQDPPPPQREQRAESLADEALRPGRAGPFRVRRVPEEKIDPAISDLCELADVGLEPVDGRVVELPVARVQHAAGPGLDHERDGVGDRVRDPNQLDAEGTELERRSLGIRLDELGRLREPVLVELRLDQAESETRGHDRLDLDLAQEVREAADVILVAVRQDDRPDATSLEVADVREQQVDAEVLVAREGEAGVDDEQLPARLVHGHVLAHLAEAAERDDAKGLAHETECMRVLDGGRRAMRQPAAAARAARGSREPRRAPRPSPRPGEGGGPRPRGPGGSGRT